METLEGTRVIVKTSDDNGTLEGTYLGTTDEAGVDFIVLDIGEAEPIKINSGFVIWMQEKPKGRVKDFQAERKKRLKVISPGG